MFENLVEILKANPRKIVYTEGSDARILESAARLKKGGFLTPIIDSMITLAGAMHNKNFYETSRYNLEYLGIDNMSKEELLAYLNDGTYLR